MIAQYPEEKELHERAALYIRFCERHLAAVPPPVETPEDRVYAATLAINNGAVDDAVSHLTAALAKEIEAKVESLKAEARAELAAIDRMGGAVAAIDYM